MLQATQKRIWRAAGVGGLLGWITLEIVMRHIGHRGERVPVELAALAPFSLGFGLWSIAGGPFLNRKPPDPSMIVMGIVAALGACFLYAYLMKSILGI